MVEVARDTVDDGVVAIKRHRTATSTFGVSRRENHDASDFYQRFPAPLLSSDATVERQGVVDEIFCTDARRMDAICSNSVALVVTSPPYFAGKEYETALGEGHVPETYGEYLDMLEAVFEECRRVLEPGGRIAVNVANLGRKPYRSLSADVITILQDRLGFLLRGEVLWIKARGSAGSCAWGSFQRPANPVLRDLTERVVIAGKGRLDRALSAREREKEGLPSTVTISRDEFMEATTDVWELAPESASRVGHPAPFPIALPERLIHLYTYEGDIVLDPFMGSGTTAVAAVRTGRHYLGFETDPAYVTAARDRVQQASRVDSVRLVANVSEDDDHADAIEHALRAGRAFKDVVEMLLVQSGFTDVHRDVRIAPGLKVAFEARDQRGSRCLFDLVGALTVGSTGAAASDDVWRALGRAAVVREVEPATPLVIVTSGLPGASTPAGAALRAVRKGGMLIADTICVTDEADRVRLVARAASK